MQARRFVTVVLVVVGALTLPSSATPGQQVPAAPSYRVPLLVFSGFDAGNANGSAVYTVEPDGTSITKLTEAFDGTAVGPAISPDGSTIAYLARTEGSGAWEIRAMYPDGTNNRLVTRMGATDETSRLAWSPDGSRLAVALIGCCPFTDFDIQVFHYPAGVLVDDLTEDLPGISTNPSYSPDGSRIVFSHRADGTQVGDVWIMDADGTNKVNLTADLPGWDLEPVFSPDGTRIAFASVSGETFDILEMDVDGGNREVVVGSTDRSERAPAFSPDGSQLAFTRTGVGEAVWVAAADGTNPIELTPGSGRVQTPSWGLVAPRLDDVAAQIGGVSGQVTGVGADVAALAERVDEAEASLEAAIAAIGAPTSDAHTDSLCVSGSIRSSATQTNQMYVDLLSFTAQTVRVDFLTNAGTFGEDVALQAGVRRTIDVNARLTAPGRPLAGRTDIDVSVHVTADAAAHVRCPTYFTRGTFLNRTGGVLHEQPDHN